MREIQWPWNDRVSVMTSQWPRFCVRLTRLDWLLGWNLLSVVRLLQLSVYTRLIIVKKTLGGFKSVRIYQVSVYSRCPFDQVWLYFCFFKRWPSTAGLIAGWGCVHTTHVCTWTIMNWTRFNERAVNDKSTEPNLSEDGKGSDMNITSNHCQYIVLHC